MAPSSQTGNGIRDTIAAERRDLAGVLGSLPLPAWDTPTLCAGWRVRELAAHITMPFRYSGARFAVELLKAGGNFGAMADRCARRDAAALSPAELTAALADNVHHPWKPPGGGLEGALTHDVVHGLDATVPLGIGRQVPPGRLRIVLANVTGPKSLRHFGTDLAGVQLRADDLDWSFGSGTPLTGHAQDLLLAVCGRKLPAGLLHGEPAPRFTS